MCRKDTKQKRQRDKRKAGERHFTNQIKREIGWFLSATEKQKKVS